MLVLIAAFSLLGAGATSEPSNTLAGEQIAEEVVVMDILRKAQPRIAAHWTSCIEWPLEGFSYERTARVDRALVAYFEELKPGMARNDILSAMQRLFARLDEINHEVEDRILETDERELLVPIIRDGAAAAGLNLDEFPDGDPTLEYRNF